MIRWIYLRGLGAIYLIAFASLLPQEKGLWGSDGILPITNFLRAVTEALPGPASFFTFPSIFWLNSSDTMLVGVTIFGCIASIMAMLGVLAAPAFILCWFLYLSFCTVGQDFLAFQWDSLLLEAGFLAMFMAPWVVRDKRTTPDTPRSVIFMFMTRWLLFRLMLLSGLVKVVNDEAWRKAIALDYHYETQPLPTPLAWYVHQLPSQVDTICCVIMLIIELLVPFLMLCPRPARIVAAVATIALQIGILLTGNYTFFNLLTILLCVSLFDNTPLPRLHEGDDKRKFPWLPTAVAIMIFAISIEEIADEFTGGAAISPTAQAIVSFVQPLRLVNTYGLFAVMTKTRDEISIEGSNDGEEWKPYIFTFKPGPLDRALPIVAPYQPRLDWQMWFASLGSVRRNPWFANFAIRLMQGKPEVLGLLQTNPFPDRPPKWIRATIATYHFTTFAEHDKTHNWWKADPPTLYLPQVENNIQ